MMDIIWNDVYLRANALTTHSPTINKSPLKGTAILCSILMSFSDYKMWNFYFTGVALNCLPVDVVIFYKERYFLFMMWFEMKFENIFFQTPKKEAEVFFRMPLNAVNKLYAHIYWIKPKLFSPPCQNKQELLM